MEREQYSNLYDMHGLVKIRVDQSALKFPFFFLSMSSGVWSTLAPAMPGDEYYTIPHVRMAWGYGVKIKLFECEYCEQTCEPYKHYMGLFEKKKTTPTKEDDDYNKNKLKANHNGNKNMNNKKNAKNSTKTKDTTTKDTEQGKGG